MTELLNQRSLLNNQKICDLNQLFKARMKLIQDSSSMFITENLTGTGNGSRSESPINPVSKIILFFALDSSF